VTNTYDRRSLTYANSFDSPAKALIIKTIEWFTGKLTILRLVRKFERQGPPTGQAFWPAVLKVMGIELKTPQSQLDRIPTDGPVVVVANHPHGLVDGMIFADLVGRVRNDYRILTRALLTGIDEAATEYMIPVPFPYEDDAQKKFVEMRARAMAHLKQGGLVALFPSGVVASSDTAFACRAVSVRRRGLLRYSLWPRHRARMERLHSPDDPPLWRARRSDILPWLQFAPLPDRQSHFRHPAPGPLAPRSRSRLQQKPSTRRGRAAH